MNPAKEDLLVRFHDDPFLRRQLTDAQLRRRVERMTDKQVVEAHRMLDDPDFEYPSDDEPRYAPAVSDVKEPVYLWYH